MGGFNRILIVIAVVLATVSLAARQSKGRIADQSFIKEDLPAYGVTLVGPTDARSDELIEALVKSKPDVDRASAKRLTVFVVNGSSKTIKAISLAFVLTTPEGPKIRVDCGLIPTPDDLTDRFANDSGLGIAPGKTRGFSAIPGLRDDGISGLIYPARTNQDQRDHRRAVIEKRLSAKKIHVAIDGVLFEDGTFVGANATHLLERVSAQARAWRDLNVEAAGSVENGSPDEWPNLLAFFRAAATANTPERGSLHANSEEDYYASFKRTYAQQYASRAEHSDPSLFISWVRREAQKKELLRLTRTSN